MESNQSWVLRLSCGILSVILIITAITTACSGKPARKSSSSSPATVTSVSAPVVGDLDQCWSALQPILLKRGGTIDVLECQTVDSEGRVQLRFALSDIEVRETQRVLGVPVGSTTSTLRAGTDLTQFQQLAPDGEEVRVAKVRSIAADGSELTIQLEPKDGSTTNVGFEGSGTSLISTMEDILQDLRAALVAK